MSKHIHFGMPYDFSKLEEKILADAREKFPYDVHSARACEMFGTNVITKEMRRIAKAENFKLLYGGKPKI